MQVSVSFLKSKYDEKETIKKIEKTNADYIHVDIMDGKFVKEKTYQYADIKKLLGNSIKKLDVHLMVKNPETWVKKIAMLNTEYITFHLEAENNPLKLIDTIKNVGLKPGISIKPKTNVKKIIPYLKDVHLVLIMSVEPGKGGQEFLYNQIDKIKMLDKLRKENNYIYKIAIDGGINDETAALAIEAGANIIVSGSFICQSDDFQEQIDKIKI